MKILFSPSEQKTSLQTAQAMELFGGREFREKILKSYNTIIQSGTTEEILNLFGLKKPDDAKPYMVDIFTAATTKAIQQYDGVAYSYLKYHTLDSDAKRYLDTNMLIFSNLFGVVLASDTIPTYKVKQGNSIGNLAPEKFYKPLLTPLLKEYLQDEEVLDLRAGYYEKFYKHNSPYTTLKFLKNGRVVSHFAKAYRGIVAREIAKNNITTLGELGKLEIENLQIKEIQTIRNKTEIIYNIL